MKKFRFDPVKTTPPPEQQSKPSKVPPSKQQTVKQAKQSKLQKDIALLTQNINNTAGNIAQTKKMLDIDLFLKKQKEKRLDYAKKLNAQYQHDKQQREKKLYRNNKEQKTQKLNTNTIKSELPLNIFGALDQIQKADQTLKKWILDDHHYQLDQMLLDKNKSQMFGDNLNKAEEECLKIKNDNVWKRAKEVSSNSAQIRYFPVIIQQNQLQPSDYSQTLMSVLTLMPSSLSQHLYHQYSDVSRQKYFMLRLFSGGQKKTILTNEFLQARQFHHKLINVTSRSKDNLTFWSSILQKGFRKLFYKQYQKFTLPEMINNIYGVDAEIIQFNNKCTIRENFPKLMKMLHKEQPKAMIGFINDRTDTPQRIYPLLDVILPGAVSDPKKKKKKQQKSSQPHNTDVLYHVSNPYSGSLLSSNFINKFTINQLHEKFNKMIVLRELPNRWGGLRIFVQFLSNGPISFTGSSWTHNNQYSFTLTKASNIHLALRRRWGSYIDPSQKEDDHIYGYMLFKSQNGETEVSCLKLQALVHKGKSTDQEGCIYDGFLQKGTYVFIPYSHSVSQQYMQLFNLDIMTEKQEYLSVNKSKMHEYYYQSQETTTDKVLQRLQSKIKYQKPKSQKITVNKLHFQNNKNPINVGQIESLGLALMNQVNCEDYFLPGRLKKLFTNGEVKIEKKQKVSRKSAQNEEVELYEKEQALKTILGYDILMGEDINYGQMRNIIEETAEEVDFANFGLGQEGLMAMIQPIMQMPRIVKLNLSHNDLNDSSITYLCYYLQKGNRKELKQLILTGNPLGRNSQKALKGLVGLFPDLKITGIKI